MAKAKKNTKSGPIFILIIMPLLAIAISSLAVYRGVENYITTSRYFNIQGIAAEGIQDSRYLDLIKKELVGVNIFSVDTTNLADRIRRKFPTFYSVVVTRVLPSQLVILAKERKPVALLKRDVYYLLDAEGVILGAYPLDAMPNFPLIMGEENKLPNLKVGANYRRSLEFPLLLARVLRAHKNEIENSFSADNRWTVTKIFGDNPGNMSFVLGEGLEVKVNKKTLEEKIDFLPSIIRTIGRDISAVKYIDLRPKEPVIAAKNQKGKK